MSDSKQCRKVTVRRYVETIAGYTDTLFVSPRYGRRGVRSVLLAVIRRRAIVAGAQRSSADVSITSRPFFERHGFFAIAEQHPVSRGVCMANFHMMKSLIRERWVIIACRYRARTETRG